MKTKSPSSGASRKISSIRQLAKAVGRSHTAVCRWVSHRDWPFGAGPWSRRLVDRMKRWAADMLSPDYSQAPYVGNSVRKPKPSRPESPIDKEIRECVDREFESFKSDLPQRHV